MRTLKEQYAVKTLKTKLRKIDENMLLEGPDRLIVEAFNKQHMAAAIDIVKKLKSFNFGSLSSLSSARDAAINDVTAVLAGDKNVGIVRRIVNLFKNRKENPLLDVIAFADAMKNFFEQFTQYMTTLSSDDQQTLATVVTGKTPEELRNAETITGLAGEQKKQLQNLHKIITNGFKPSGTLANVSKNWIDKYLGGRGNLKQLAGQMMAMKVSELKQIAVNVSESLKNVGAVGQAAANASTQETITSTGSTGSEPTKSPEQAQGTADTKAATATGTTPVTASSEASQKHYDAIKNQLTGVDQNTAMAVINALAGAGRLKSVNTRIRQ